MKKESLQYRVLYCDTVNRTETDYQPQPIELGVSLSYLQEPDKTKGLRKCHSGKFLSPFYSYK